jgi:hypothetical protein
VSGETTDWARISALLENFVGSVSTRSDSAVIIETAWFIEDRHGPARESEFLRLVTSGVVQAIDLELCAHTCRATFVPLDRNEGYFGVLKGKTSSIQTAPELRKCWSGASQISMTIDCQGEGRGFESRLPHIHQTSTSFGGFGRPSERGYLDDAHHSVL